MDSVTVNELNRQTAKVLDTSLALKRAMPQAETAAVEPWIADWRPDILGDGYAQLVLDTDRTGRAPSRPCSSTAANPGPARSQTACCPVRPRLYRLLLLPDGPR